MTSRRDPHFGQDLQHAFFDARLISIQTILGRHVRIWILTVMLDQRFQSQVRMNGIGTKTS